MDLLEANIDHLEISLSRFLKGSWEEHQEAFKA